MSAFLIPTAQWGFGLSLLYTIINRTIPSVNKLEYYGFYLTFILTSQMCLSLPYFQVLDIFYMIGINK